VRYQQWQPHRIDDPHGGSFLRFDGVDDRVQMEGPVVPPDLFTAECRLRLAAGPPEHGKGHLVMATAAAAFVLTVTPERQVRASRHSDGRWQAVGAPTPLDDNWHRLAVTCDGSRLTLYVDGEPVGSTPVAANGKLSRFDIGFNSVTDGMFLHGDVDDVRIHNRILTPDEFLR
jgi:hypothetical protein